VELLKQGDTAPAFDVPDHRGNRVRLADHAGHHVLLWFYPKADTPG
jgi:peroxiredoxin Q/BCP